MSGIRLSLLIILTTIPIVSCGRSELIRIRLLSPVSETKTDHSLFKDKTLSTSTKKTTATEPISSGGSLYFLFKSIGLGYSTITTKFENEVSESISDTMLLRENTTIETNFADLVFGLGENYTIMWGVGVLAGGGINSTLNYGYSGVTDETIVQKELSGHSLFFALAHHGFGFETLLGFRTNYIKAELDDSLSSASKLKLANSITYESTGLRFTTTQVQLGIGVTF